MSTKTQNIITVPPPEPPSAVALRTAYLQRRCHLSPAVASVVAELMLTPPASWHARAC